MIPVDRGELPEDLAGELERLQAEVDAGSAGDDPWTVFSRTDTYRQVRALLERAFHRKCGYCEKPRARTIDHYWPKSPHPHNYERGTPARMMRWDNFVLACTDCQGWECKGTRMRWSADGHPLLLDPCRREDDPLDYLQVSLPPEPDVEQETQGQFTAGWVDPVPGLEGLDLQRAEYTVRLLKLNERYDLVEARARNARRFMELMHYLRELGPDYEAPSGHSVRRKFIDLLSAPSPHLGPLRQILYGTPNSAELRRELLQQVPELEPILSEWCIEPANRN